MVAPRHRQGPGTQDQGRDCGPRLLFSNAPPSRSESHEDGRAMQSVWGTRTWCGRGGRQAKGIRVLDAERLPWERDRRALGNPRGQDRARSEEGNLSLL